MSSTRQVCVYQPEIVHVLPTHELTARRERKLAPTVVSQPRRPIDPHPRTGRRTVEHPGTSLCGRSLAKPNR